MGQDRIGTQIAAMTPAQRQRLIAEFPQQVGNTDGVPYISLCGNNGLACLSCLSSQCSQLSRAVIIPWVRRGLAH